jgi:hypothetical protein
MCVLIVSEGVIKEVIVCVYRGDHVCVCKLFNIYIYIYIYMSYFNYIHGGVITLPKYFKMINGIQCPN